ncbi:MAG: phospholipid carrier-dependent glycosyltransferase, partial [Candidatus Dadabacteria bacterium]
MAPGDDCGILAVVQGRMPYRAALAAIILAALFMRWYGSTWGAPYGFHFDEPFVVKPALRIVATGDLDPRFFRYPSAMIYAEAAVAAAWHFLAGMPVRIPHGPAYGPSDLGPWTWPALITGRRLVGLAGALTSLAVAALVLESTGIPGALAAAALLALVPLHVEHSHYLTTDVPMAALVVLAFALAARARSRAGIAAVGLAAGAAVATKYTGAAALPGLLAIAILTAPNGERLSRALVLLGATACGFVLLCPYAVLDWRLFVADLAVVREHYASGHLGAEGSANWLWYIERLRESGLGTWSSFGYGFAFLAGTAGLLVTTKRRPTQPAWALLAASLTAIAWFAWLGAVPVRFERNLLPPLVLATAVAGDGIARLARIPGRPRLSAACALLGAALV